MESQLCVLACSALGETGGIVFAVLALIYGVWQRRSKVQTRRERDSLRVEKEKLEHERDHFRDLSQRPPTGGYQLPPLPIHLVYAGPQGSLQPPPPSSEPDAAKREHEYGGPHDDDEDTSP